MMIIMKTNHEGGVRNAKFDLEVITLPKVTENRRSGNGEDIYDSLIMLVFISDLMVMSIDKFLESCTAKLVR